MKQLGFTAVYMVLLLVLSIEVFRPVNLFQPRRGAPGDAILLWPWRR